MKIGFYYHIPLTVKEGKYFLPSYFGVFLDSLASNVEVLFLILHEARVFDASEADYELKSSNIIWINLKFKTPAWHRTFFPAKTLKGSFNLLKDCELIIVRSPTPLAAFFQGYYKKKVVFMIVGDFVEGYKKIKYSSLRDFFVYYYFLINDYFFNREIRMTDVLVNSPELYRKYSKVARSIYQIKTTTLSDKDFHFKESVSFGSRINVLYTGRIDPAKGLFELLEAIAILREQSVDVCLNIVGWEGYSHRPIETKMKQKAQELGVSEYLIFHGKKVVGHELNEMYRNSDIYVIPSYHEGFPRTIWEAMANSLPVIATNVGGIPDFLENKKHALLINPKSTNEIVNALIKIIENKEFREKMVLNSFELAKSNTLEVQSKLIIEILNKLL